MTTAKPHQTAGQSDSADDLIAELAKLMAQDAQTDRPVPVAPTTQPAAPPAAPVVAPAIRIPGIASEPQPEAVPVPRFMPETTASPQEPAPTPAAQSQSGEPAPFRFDFDQHTGQRPAQPAPQPAAPVPEAHDTIADLIAAELQVEPVAQAVVRPTVQPEVPAFVAPGVVSQPEPAKPVFRPVNLTPIAKPENDKFRVAPVFGLGTTQPSAPPAPVNAPAVAVPPNPAPSPAPAETAIAPVAPVSGASADPIDEIENLIGRAVRVELDKGAERPAPSPALRSLATPTVPQPAPKPTPSRSLSGADEAILAAAAATGAEVGWVDPVDTADAEAAPVQRRRRKDRAPRASGTIRALVGPVVAVALLLVAGFGLYWVLGLGRTQGPAPVLVADTAPVKQAPVTQPETAQAQQSVVFNEMDGVVPGAEEQLVSRDQADVNEVTRVVTPDLSEEGLANRKVRTVTVRPDGSIVSGDDTLAGTAILPVVRPNVPAVPGADSASPELLASTSALSTPPAQTAPAVTPVIPGSSVPVIDAAGNPVAGKIAPVPYQRPASVGDAPPTGPTSPVNAVIDPVGALIEPLTAPQQSTVAAAAAATPPAQSLVASVASAQPEAPAQQAATTPSGPAPAYFQLASQRSEADARATVAQMTTRYGALFGGASLEIQRVDLGERGIYYRVRGPAASLQSAAQICASVKANGGDCLAM